MFNQRGFIPILMLLVVVLLAGFAVYQKQTTSPAPKSITQPASSDETVYTEQSRSANWKTYKDTENNFSLRYSDKWSIETPTGTMEPAVLILLNKMNQNSIRVIVYSTDKNSLDEWLSGIHKGQSIDEVTEKRRITIDSVEAEREIKEYSGSGQVTISAVNSGKSYQIITTFKNNKEAVLKDFDQILSTFRFD